MKIIHLSDTHMLPEGRQLFGVDPGLRLERCLAHINRKHPDADLCVITGDLANQGQPEAYVRMRELLSGLRPPCRLLLGNHDRRDSFLSVFGTEWTDANGYVQSRLELGANTLLFLDTKAGEPGHHGRLCDARIAWLEEELRRACAPVILFMHHPWFALGIPSVDRICLRDAGRIVKTLEGHMEKLKYLVFGHYHRFMSGTWRGVGFHTMNAVAHQIALETADPARVAGSHEEAAYGVVHFRDDGLYVQQCHFLRGEYDFWIDH